MNIRNIKKEISSSVICKVHIASTYQISAQISKPFHRYRFFILLKNTSQDIIILSSELRDGRNLAILFENMIKFKHEMCKAFVSLVRSVIKVRHKILNSDIILRKTGSVKRSQIKSTRNRYLQIKHTKLSTCNIPNSTPSLTYCILLATSSTEHYVL